jgi:hypothetical protein
MGVLVQFSADVVSSVSRSTWYYSPTSVTGKKWKQVTFFIFFHHHIICYELSTMPSLQTGYRRKKTKVWFNRIQINEHCYELGDNPSVSDGAPLTISWKSQNRMVFEVEYYEIYRPSSERRGVKSGLHLSASQRARL